MPQGILRAYWHRARPQGFDAGDYFCDGVFANLAEAVINNLRAVGIRARLRPLERAAFFKGYAEKGLKNIIQGASGAFGNAATRLEAFVAKGGAYVYGTYPEIDALFEEQARSFARSKSSCMSAQSTCICGRTLPFMVSAPRLANRVSP